MKGLLHLLPAVILALLIVLPASAVENKGIGVSGYIGLQTPVIITPDRTADQTSQFVGGLALTRLPLNMTLTADVHHSLRTGDAYDSESKVRTTLWFPVNRRLTAYTFWESRYEDGQDRWVAGLRWNFSVRK